MTFRLLLFFPTAHRTCFPVIPCALTATHHAPITRSTPSSPSSSPYYLPLLLPQPKEQGFDIWKAKHSQHCYNFHFEAAGCHRDRTCSFLHADPTYSEAVAYG